MDCEEAVYSNDYYDFIGEYILEARRTPPEVCVQKLDSTYEIVYLPRAGNPPLNITVTTQFPDVMLLWTRAL